MENYENEKSPFIVYGGVDYDPVQRSSGYGKWLLALFVFVAIFLIWFNVYRGWTRTGSVGGTGGNEFDFKCPNGTGVYKIEYSADQGLDSIKVGCKGFGQAGTTADEIFSEMYGGHGGTNDEFLSPEGMNGMYVTGNQFVGNITPASSAVMAPNFEKGGKAQGQWAGSTQLLSCPPGSLIAGVYGRSDTYVDALGFHCH